MGTKLAVLFSAATLATVFVVGFTKRGETDDLGREKLSQAEARKAEGATQTERETHMHSLTIKEVIAILAMLTGIGIALIATERRHPVELPAFTPHTPAWDYTPAPFHCEHIDI